MSPPSLDNKSSIAANASVCSLNANAGQKRPATNSPPNPREATGFKQPATQGNYTGLEWSTSESQAGQMTSQNPIQSSIQALNPGQMPMNYGQNTMPGQPNQVLPQRPGMPNPSSHLGAMNQPNPPNVTITNKGPQHQDGGIRPQRGHSPVPSCGPRMQWNQSANPLSPASTSPTTSVLATQLNMRHNNPQMPGNPNVSLAQVQSSMNNPQNVLNLARGNLSNLNLHMTTTSPAPMSGNNSLAAHQNLVTFGMQNPQQAQQQTGMPNAMQASLQSKMEGGNATDGNNPLQVGKPIGVRGQGGGILPQGGTSQQQQSNNNPSAVTTKDRRTIWQGVLDFQEKLKLPQVQGQRVQHSLTCTFSVGTTSEDSDVNADKWPGRLTLQLIPRQLIAESNLFSILKTAARHVLIHFNQESESLNKLCKNMSSGLVGCIQFPQTCDIRIMVVIYMPNKQIYMGFIAHDQEGFFNSIKQRYENERKQQQQRLQLLANIPPSDGSMANQPVNPTNPNMMPQQQNVNEYEEIDNEINRLIAAYMLRHHSQVEAPSSTAQQTDVGCPLPNISNTSPSSALPQTSASLLYTSPSSQRLVHDVQSVENTLKKSQAPLVPPSTSKQNLPGQPAGTIHVGGTQTTNVGTQSSQGASTSGDENSAAAQASEIFGKDLVQKVVTKKLAETGKRSYTVEELCDEILKHEETRPKPVEERSKKEISEELLCKICLDQRLSIVFEPCGHLATCQECSQSLTKCPMCRTAVRKKMRIYM